MTMDQLVLSISQLALPPGREEAKKRAGGSSGGINEMISDEYIFEKFLDAMLDKNILEIQVIASREAGEAERLSSSSTRGIDKATKLRIGHYTKRVGEFAFFMKHRIKPGDVNEEDFRLFRPIYEKLVEKGDLNPDVLKHFEERN